jgi:hypothetical protein
VIFEANDTFDLDVDVDDYYRLVLGFQLIDNEGGRRITVVNRQQMASVMSVANNATTVVSCHIVRTAGLRMKKELKSAPTASNPYTKPAAGAGAVRVATASNALKRNALGSRTGVLSSE